MSGRTFDANSGAYDSFDGGVFVGTMETKPDNKKQTLKSSSSLPAITEGESDRIRIERLSLVLESAHTSDLNDLVIRVKPRQKSKKRKGKRKSDLEVDGISLCSHVSSDPEEKKISVERDFCLSDAKSTSENVQSWLTTSFEEKRAKEEKTDVKSEEKVDLLLVRDNAKCNIPQSKSKYINEILKVKALYQSNREALSSLGGIAAGSVDQKSDINCNVPNNPAIPVGLPNLHIGHRNISDDSIDSGIASSNSYMPDMNAAVVVSADPRSVASSCSSEAVLLHRQDDTSSIYSASDDEPRETHPQR